MSCSKFAGYGLWPLSPQTAALHTVPAGGLLKLYETTGSTRWLSWAQELQSTMDELFWNQQSGGSGLPGSQDLHGRLASAVSRLPACDKICRC